MLDVLWQGRVEQATDGHHRVALHKQILRLEGAPDLSLVRKHALDGPTRPPVVLVHGFAQNRYSWHTSRRSLSAWLADQGHDVWNLELRGHGRSRSLSRGAEQFSDYVDDLVRTAEILPEPAFWLGHSLGAAVCYAAATQAPTRGVMSLGGIYTFAQHNWFLGLATGLTHASRHTFWAKYLQLRTQAFGRVLSRLYGLTDVAGYTLPISGWWPGTIEPEILEERLTTGFDWTSMKVWMEMSRWGATGEFEYDAAWRALDVPLFVVLGDMDQLVHVDDGRAAYDRSGSTDRSLLLLDDYRHEVHWGHLDIVLGRLAPTYVWPALATWMHQRA